MSCGYKERVFNMPVRQPSKGAMPSEVDCQQPPQINGDTMAKQHASQIRLPPKKDFRSDTEQLQQQIQKVSPFPSVHALRNTDSPLDLSVKTRKRSPDTTIFDPFLSGLSPMKRPKVPSQLAPPSPLDLTKTKNSSFKQIPGSMMTPPFLVQNSYVYKTAALKTVSPKPKSNKPSKCKEVPSPLKSMSDTVGSNRMANNQTANRFKLNAGYIGYPPLFVPTTSSVSSPPSLSSKSPLAHPDARSGLQMSPTVRDFPTDSLKSQRNLQATSGHTSSPSYDSQHCLTLARSHSSQHHQQQYQYNQQRQQQQQQQSQQHFQPHQTSHQTSRQMQVTNQRCQLFPQQTSNPYLPGPQPSQTLTSSQRQLPPSPHHHRLRDQELSQHHQQQSQQQRLQQQITHQQQQQRLQQHYVSHRHQTSPLHSSSSLSSPTTVTIASTSTPSLPSPSTSSARVSNLLSGRAASHTDVGNMTASMSAKVFPFHQMEAKKFENCSTAGKSHTNGSSSGADLTSLRYSPDSTNCSIAKRNTTDLHAQSAARLVARHQSQLTPMAAQMHLSNQEKSNIQLMQAGKSSSNKLSSLASISSYQQHQQQKMYVPGPVTQSIASQKNSSENSKRHSTNSSGALTSLSPSKQALMMESQLNKAYPSYQQQQRLLYMSNQTPFAPVPLSLSSPSLSSSTTTTDVNSTSLTSVLNISKSSIPHGVQKQQKQSYGGSQSHYSAGSGVEVTYNSANNNSSSSSSSSSNSTSTTTTANNHLNLKSPLHSAMDSLKSVDSNDDVRIISPTTSCNSRQPKDVPIINVISDSNSSSSERSSLKVVHSNSSGANSKEYQNSSNAADSIPPYSTPLSINIPSDISAEASHSSASNKKVDVIITKSASESKDPKLGSRKHIIMNAVNQDEALKKAFHVENGIVTVNPHEESISESSLISISPTPSPKMPILSPQHKNPPRVGSPSTSEPPPLEPSSATFVDNSSPDAFIQDNAEIIMRPALEVKRNSTNGIPQNLKPSIPYIHESMYRPHFTHQEVPHPLYGHPMSYPSAFNNPNLHLPYMPISLPTENSPLQTNRLQDGIRHPKTAMDSMRDKRDGFSGRSTIRNKNIPVANVAPIVQVKQHHKTAITSNNSLHNSVNVSHSLHINHRTNNSNTNNNNSNNSNISNNNNNSNINSSGVINNNNSNNINNGNNNNSNNNSNNKNNMNRSNNSNSRSPSEEPKIISVSTDSNSRRSSTDSKCANKGRDSSDKVASPMPRTFFSTKNIISMIQNSDSDNILESTVQMCCDANTPKGKMSLKDAINTLLEKHCQELHVDTDNSDKISSCMSSSKSSDVEIIENPFQKVDDDDDDDDDDIVITGTETRSKPDEPATSDMKEQSLGKQHNGNYDVIAASDYSPNFQSNRIPNERDAHHRLRQKLLGSVNETSNNNNNTNNNNNNNNNTSTDSYHRWNESDDQIIDSNKPQNSHISSAVHISAEHPGNFTEIPFQRDKFPWDTSNTLNKRKNVEKLNAALKEKGKFYFQKAKTNIRRMAEELKRKAVMRSILYKRTFCQDVSNELVESQSKRQERSIVTRASTRKSSSQEHQLCLRPRAARPERGALIEKDSEEEESLPGCWEIESNSPALKLRRKANSSNASTSGSSGKKRGGLMMTLHWRPKRLSHKYHVADRRTYRMLSYYQTHALSVRSKLLPKRYGSRNIQWTELRRIRTSPALRLRRRLQRSNETRDEETESGTSNSIPMPPEIRRLAINKNSGETLLHRSARCGYQDVLYYCLKTRSVDVNARDNAGFTPLHECCVRGNLYVARYLISYGADVNQCSQDGIRPIHDAVENDHLEMVRLLLAFGADPLLTTYSGKSPIKIARSGKMINLLKDYINDLNGDDNHAFTPWEFHGSWDIKAFDREVNSGNPIFADIPSDPDPKDITDEEIFKFDDFPLKAVTLRSKQEEKCITVQDLATCTGLTCEELKETCPSSIFTMKPEEFLKETVDSVCLGVTLSKIEMENSDIDLIHLREYPAVLSAIQKSKKNVLNLFHTQSHSDDNKNNSSGSSSSNINNNDNENDLRAVSNMTKVTAKYNAGSNDSFNSNMPPSPVSLSDDDVLILNEKSSSCSSSSNSSPYQEMSKQTNIAAQSVIPICDNSEKTNFKPTSTESSSIRTLSFNKKYTARTSNHVAFDTVFSSSKTDTASTALHHNRHFTIEVGAPPEDCYKALRIDQSDVIKERSKNTRTSMKDSSQTFTESLNYDEKSQVQSEPSVVIDR